MNLRGRLGCPPLGMVSGPEARTGPWDHPRSDQPEHSPALTSAPASTVSALRLRRPGSTARGPVSPIRPVASTSAACNHFIMMAERRHVAGWTLQVTWTGRRREDQHQAAALPHLLPVSTSWAGGVTRTVLKPRRRAGSLRSPEPAWPHPRPRSARLDRCEPSELGYGLALPLPRGKWISAYTPTFRWRSTRTGPTSVTAFKDSPSGIRPRCELPFQVPP
jgi:hypothetical protein